jgi:hypothetical protein
MIHDVIGAALAVGEMLELPMDLYDIIHSLKSSESRGQHYLSASFSRIFILGDSPASDKLLAEMKDMGRTESESTLAYKWALEQNKLQN